MVSGRSRRFDMRGILLQTNRLGVILRDFSPEDLARTGRVPLDKSEGSVKGTLRLGGARTPLGLGGWLILLMMSVFAIYVRVPRPCVLCKGG